MDRTIPGVLFVMAVFCIILAVIFYAVSLSDFDCTSISTDSCTVNNEMVHEQQKTQQVTVAVGLFVGGVVAFTAFLLTLHYTPLDRNQQRLENIEDVELAFEEIQRKRKR